MSKPLVKNAGDREQVQDAADKVKRRRELELADLHAVLQTPQGRRLVWRLLEKSQPLDVPFVDNSLRQAHVIGCGNVGRMLIADLFEPGLRELYFQMVDEARKREETDA